MVFATRTGFKDSSFRLYVIIKRKVRKMGHDVSRMVNSNYTTDKWTKISANLLTGNSLSN